MTIYSYAENYASHPLSRGDMYPNLVWTFYLAGKDAGPDFFPG